MIERISLSLFASVALGCCGFLCCRKSVAGTARHRTIRGIGGVVACNFWIDAFNRTYWVQVLEAGVKGVNSGFTGCFNVNVDTTAQRSRTFSRCYYVVEEELSIEVDVVFWICLTQVSLFSIFARWLTAYCCVSLHKTMLKFPSRICNL